MKEIWSQHIGQSLINCICLFDIYTSTMEYFSVEYWQENWETLMDRVENGETIGVVNENGDKAVMVPADDELIRLYTDHEEGS